MSTEAKRVKLNIKKGGSVTIDPTDTKKPAEKAKPAKAKE